METITVRANRGGRVALFDRHPAYPGGELFLAGDTVATVPLTPAVSAAIASGALIVVEPVHDQETGPVPNEVKPAMIADLTPRRRRK